MLEVLAVIALAVEVKIPPDRAVGPLLGICERGDDKTMQRRLCVCFGRGVHDVVAILDFLLVREFVWLATLLLGFGEC